MTCKIEHRWTTKSGLTAVILLVLRNDGTRRHRCGYVRVLETHPLFGIGYSDQAPAITAEDVANITLGKRGILTCFTATVGADAENVIRRSPNILFDVHGGITFSDTESEYLQSDTPSWWFGFDCAHYGDAEIEPGEYSYFDSTSVIRTREYVEAECESLAQQLAEFGKAAQKPEDSPAKSPASLPPLDPQS